MSIILRIVLILIAINSSLKAVERLEYKMIAGVPCAQFTIINGKNYIKANLLIDFGMISPLVMLSDAADVLEIEDNSSLSLRYAGGIIEGIAFSQADLGELDTFSMANSAELNDIALWGILGISAFDSRYVKINLYEGYLEYGDDLELAENHAGIKYTEDSSRLILELEPDPGYTLPALICSSEFQTVFDEDCAALAGSEYGEFENCLIGDFKLNDFTAVQTSSELSSTLSIADAALANSFWQNFVVTVDTEQKEIYLERVSQELISDLGEQEYFNALLDSSFDDILEYVNGNPESRLLSDAVNSLLQIALDNDNSLQRQLAMDILTESCEPDRAVELLVGYAEKEIENNNNDACKYFLEYARKLQISSDLKTYNQAKIDTYLGYLALADKDYLQARKCLLAALFLKSEDPFTNYLMGKYYLETDKTARAWSRFLKAAMADDSYDEAINQLRHMDQNGQLNGVITLQDACDFLDGNILEDDGQIKSQTTMLTLRGGELIKQAIDTILEELDD